jgi:hypothetical protein
VELNNLFGLPAHPLVVHAVVVLVPLAALGAIAVALSPALRQRYGSLVALVALADLVLVPLATGSGEQLEDRITETALVEQHAEMGEQLLPFVAVMAAAVVALLLLHRLLARLGDATPRPAWAAPWVVSLAVVLTLLGSVGSLVQAARIGHSGAKSAWSNVR